MPEKKVDYLDGLDLAEIKKTAETEIKPRLVIDGLGIDNGVNVEILTVPILVDTDSEKVLSDDGSLLVMSVIYEGVEHYIVAEPISLRRNLMIIAHRNFTGKFEDLIGQRVKIWMEQYEHKKFGLTTSYQVALL